MPSSCTDVVFPVKKEKEEETDDCDLLPTVPDDALLSIQASGTEISPRRKPSQTDLFKPDMAFLTEENAQDIVEAMAQANNREAQDIMAEEVGTREAEDVDMQEDGSIEEDVEQREVGENSTVTGESSPGVYRAGADRW